MQEDVMDAVYSIKALIWHVMVAVYSVMALQLLSSAARAVLLLVHSV